MAVGQRDRLVEVLEARDADERAERLGVRELVVGAHAADERGVEVQPALGIVAHEALTRVGRGDAARCRSSRARRGGRARGPATPPRSAAGSARRSSGRRGRPGSGRRRAQSRPRAASRARNSSWTPSWTIAVPSDVQRWPAVPKPLNSAPSTARSRSASSMTTSGFLPPSSRHGDWRWRPHSSPMRAPTADEPVKPTLSTRPRSSACSRPAKVCGPSASTRFSTPSGSPPRQEQPRERGPERRRVLGGLPDDGVAAQQRRHEVPRRHRDREVARRDDRRDADRLAEGEELLVGHLAGDGLAVQAPALAEEEVARVDDLLDLAERLGVGLADLAASPAARAPPCWPRPGGRPAGSPGRARAPARPPSPAARRARPRTPRRTSPRRRAAPRRRPRRCRPGWSRPHARPERRSASVPAMIEATVEDTGRTLPRGPAQAPVASAGVSQRSLVVVGAGVFGASLARHCARAGWAVTLVERVVARPRARGLGRRVAPHPLRARRRRLAHALGAPRAGAVARDRPGARRRGGRRRGSPAARTAGRPTASACCARSASRASAWTARGLFPSVTTERPRLRAARARGRRPARARRHARARRPGRRGGRASWCSTRRGPPAPTVVLAGGRTLEADRVVWACGAWLPALFPGVARPAHHPAGRLLLRRGRGLAHAGRPRLGRLRRRGVRPGRPRRPRREGLARRRGPGVRRRDRAARAARRARAPRPRVPRPPLPRARRRAARRHARPASTS